MMLKFVLAICLLLVVSPFQSISAKVPPETSSLAAPYHPLARIGRGSITQAVWSPDAEQFAVSGSQGIWIYKRNFEDVAHLGNSRQQSVAWSPDGNRIASIAYWQDDFGSPTSWAAQVWDVATRRLVESLPMPKGDWGVGLRWRPDGKMLAVGTSSGISLWNTASWELVRTIYKQAAYILCFAWSPDGDHLAFSTTSDVEIIDPQSGAMRLTLPLLDVQALAWRPDGRELATGRKPLYASISPDNALQIWDTQTGTLRLSIQSHNVNSLDWSPDGSMLVSASDGSYYDYGAAPIAVWNPTTGQLMSKADYAEQATASVQWSATGRYLLTAGSDNVVRVYDTDQPNADRLQNQFALPGHTDRITDLAWNPDGSQLATASVDGTVRTWDAHAGRPLQVSRSSRLRLQAVAWHPAGDPIAYGGEPFTVSFWSPTENAHWPEIPDVHTTSLSPGEGNPYGMTALAWSRDGQYLASAGYDGVVNIFKPDPSLQPDFRFPYHLRHTQEVWSLAWNPDSRRLAAATSQAIEIWQADTGKLLSKIDCDTCFIASIAWSPDGHKLAAAGFSNSDAPISAKIWDADTGKLLQTVAGTATSQVAWSPDGKRLATVRTDNQIEFWDASTLQSHGTLPGYRMAWSPLGDILAAVSEDVVITLWAGNPR
jgi:WD40 repeat protein